MSLKKIISLVLLFNFIFFYIIGAAAPIFAEDSEPLPVDNTVIKGTDKTKLDLGEKEEAKKEETTIEKKITTPKISEPASEPKAQKKEIEKPKKVKRGSGNKWIFSKGFWKLLLLVGIIIGVANNN